MIRLNKVRPYIPCQETSHNLQLYNYEEVFVLKIKSRNPFSPTEKTIIYDGGGVSGNDCNEHFFDGNGVAPTPSFNPSQVDFIIYDGGEVVLEPEMEVTPNG